MERPKLRYPVILVHGICAKDNKLFWGRIPERLSAAGMKVFMGNTDSWGCVESNALSLGRTVDAVIEKCGCSKVNLIAHSKGGVDSRFLIGSLDYAPKIASLTTVCSPHHGSEIVDFISDRKYIHTRLAKKITYTWAKLYGDKTPDPHGILDDLSTRNMAAFNERHPDHPGVYYASCHSVLKSRFDDPFYLLSYGLLHKVSGPNDGVVSLRSAQWADFSMIEGSISHTEILDIKRKKISGLDIPGIYLGICAKLSRKGC